MYQYGNRLQELPVELQMHIINLGGINQSANDALVRMQKRWRASRNIARRNAAYTLQDFLEYKRNPGAYPDSGRYRVPWPYPGWQLFPEEVEYNKYIRKRLHNFLDKRHAVRDLVTYSNNVV